MDHSSSLQINLDLDLSPRITHSLDPDLSLKIDTLSHFVMVVLYVYSVYFCFVLGHVQMVKFFLRRPQIDVNATGSLQGLSPNLRSKGGIGAKDKIFPLYIAATKHDVAIVKELLKNGANVHQTNAVGHTALHSCLRCNYGNDVSQNDKVLKTVKTLIANGADVNKQDENGYTPIHYACYNGNSDIFQFLAENGADLTVRNKQGFTPLEVAALSDHELLTEMLERRKERHSKYQFSPLEVIEALETVALIHPDPYTCLSEAMSERLKHNIQKSTRAPLDCYLFMKEVETKAELDQYKNDIEKLRIQAAIARERIHDGKSYFVNTKEVNVLKGKCFSKYKHAVFHNRQQTWLHSQ